jgi:hypothetical protein
MNDLPLFWIIVSGLFSGFVCIPFFTHWLRILLLALGKDPTSPPQPGGRVGPIIVIVFHPVTWLLGVGIPLAIFNLMTDPPSESWLWFAGAFVTSPVCVFTMVFYVLEKKKRALRQQSTSGGA